MGVYTVNFGSVSEVNDAFFLRVELCRRVTFYNVYIYMGGRVVAGALSRLVGTRNATVLSNYVGDVDFLMFIPVVIKIDNSRVQA
jgi:hypothetical protein